MRKLYHKGQSDAKKKKKTRNFNDLFNVAFQKIRFVKKTVHRWKTKIFML